MALKTQKSARSVEAFLRKVADPVRQADCRVLTRMMKQASGASPQMWGTSIVGFGSYHYVYASGREGDWPLIGYSPRKQNLVLYIMSGFSTAPKLMKQLGKHKTGKSCLYVNRLGDLDLDVLRELMDRSIAEMRRRYPATGGKKKKAAKKRPARKRTTKKPAKKRTTKKLTTA